MQVAKQSWIDIASFQIGGAISLPLILVGFELERRLGFAHALFIIGIGNVVLFALSLVGAHLSQESQSTTAETCERYLQEPGKFFFAFVILFSTTAWFAIQTSLVGRDLGYLTQKWFSIMPHEATLNCSLAGLMCCAACTGLKGMISFAKYTVLVLVLGFVYILCARASSSEKVLAHELLYSGFSLDGISLTIACAIAAVIDMPTFYRHIKGRKDAMKAATLVFFVAIPAIESVGLFLGFWSRERGLIEALIAQGGPLISISIAACIALAGWTTNNANFYSASAALATLFPKMGDRKGALVATALCIALSALPFGNSFAMLLEVMGILWTSLGGSMLGGYLLEKISGRGQPPRNYCLAVAVGILVGAASFLRGGLLFSPPCLESLSGTLLVLAILQLASCVSET